MPAIHLLDLPSEIVYNILQHAILARIWPIGVPRQSDSASGVPRALRLRLVCKVFDALFQPALFSTRIFDTYLPVSKNQATYTLRYWPVRRNHGAQKLWHSYLVYRVQNEQDPLNYRYAEIRQIAERLFNTNAPGLSLRAIIESLCWLALGNVAGMVAVKSFPNYDNVIQNGRNTSLLSAAAYLNCMDLAKRLLQEGIDPSLHDDLFPAPMEAAAMAGHADMLKLFQECLPDMVIQDDTVVSRRGFIGHTTLPTVLCKGKADPQAVVGAAFNGDLDMLQLALYPPSRSNFQSADYFEQPHGSVVERSREGLSLKSAMLHSRSVDVFRTLSEFFPPDEEHVNPAFLLERFCEFGNFDIVKHLLDSGWSSNGWVSPRTPSPLHEAARHGFEDIVDLLIDRGADINKRCGIYGTPLFAAVSGGFIAIVKKLIDKGARCDMNLLRTSLSSEYPAITRLILPQYDALEVFLNVVFLTNHKPPLDLIPMLELIGEHPKLSFKNGKIRPPVPQKSEILMNRKFRPMINALLISFLMVPIAQYLGTLPTSWGHPVFDDDGLPIKDDMAGVHLSGLLVLRSGH